MRYNNNRDVPQGPDWFDWLPFRTQYLLLLLLFVPLTVGFFLGGMHCVHTGHPVSMGNEQMDAGEFFLSSAVCLLLCGGFVAGLLGWIKPNRPHPSETHHRKPDA
jgi:hypothetical protein